MNDEMKIQSKFTTGLISKIVSKKISKMLGYDVRIDLNNLKVATDDGNGYIHIDVDAKTELKNVDDILEKLGL